MKKEGVEIVNRTSNPLESYNHRLADSIGPNRSSLVAFVDELKKQALFFLQELDDV